MNIKEKIHKVSVIALFTGTIMCTTPVMSASNIGDPAPNVTLVATLNNGPAMRGVNWSVYRLETNGSRVFVKGLTRHSASIALPTGRYQAEARLGTVMRTRTFEVTSRTSNDIVVAMD